MNCVREVGREHNRTWKIQTTSRWSLAVTPRIRRIEARTIKLLTNSQIRQPSALPPSLCNAISHLMSPKQDNRQDMMRHFPNRLLKWRGADARLWSLTVGHPTLTILLTRSDEPDCLMISCGSPERIHAPRCWSPSDISIELDTELFRVVDVQAGVCITNCAVGLHEASTHPRN